MPANPLPRPAVGVGVLIEYDHKVLLIQRNAVHGYRTWSPPGGHLEYNESFEACAMRETHEEVGLTLRKTWFIGVTNDLFEDTGQHYVTLWLAGEPIDPRAIVIAPTEVQQVDWFAWDALPTPLFLPMVNLLAGRGYGFQTLNSLLSKKNS